MQNRYPVPKPELQAKKMNFWAPEGERVDRKKKPPWSNSKYAEHLEAREWDNIPQSITFSFEEKWWETFKDFCEFLMYCV